MVLFRSCLCRNKLHQHVDIVSLVPFVLRKDTTPHPRPGVAPSYLPNTD